MTDWLKNQFTKVCDRKWKKNQCYTTFTKDLWIKKNWNTENTEKFEYLYQSMLSSHLYYKNLYRKWKWSKNEHRTLCIKILLHKLMKTIEVEESE